MFSDGWMLWFIYGLLVFFGFYENIKSSILNGCIYGKYIGL